MSLRLQPTLSEIRNSVLLRCGLAQEGSIPRNIAGLIDERIRSAERQIFELYPWTAQLVRKDFPLADNVAEYDIPDDTDIGHIDRVVIVRDSDGMEYPLERGIRPEERNVTNQKGCPLRYAYHDQIIEILPRPDTAQYTALRIDYYSTPGGMVSDADRAVVDGEALIMLSEILVREHFGMESTDALRADLATFLDRVKTNQGDGDGFQLGGHISPISQTKRRNRMLTSYNQRDYRDWHPW
jgi:hypothetical protein